MVHHKNISLQQAKIKDRNLIQYMTRLGHVPTFANAEISVFALRRQDSREIIIIINNELNQIESVRIQSNGNLLDLASLVFDVRPEQIIADPASYGLNGVISHSGDHQPSD